VSDQRIRAMEREVVRGEDPEALPALLEELLRLYEEDQERPWRDFWGELDREQVDRVLVHFDEVLDTDAPREDGVLVARLKDGRFAAGVRTPDTGCETCGWGGSPGDQTTTFHPTLRAALAMGLTDDQRRLVWSRLVAREGVA
jgi:hypothetical protein